MRTMSSADGAPTGEVRFPVVELRQYILRPGQRDALVELFDREFVESQEALGMAVVGQFRDLDRPDRFVWVRGFDDMTTRSRALQEFYGGPVWKAHGRAANATMLDSDDVLLLRPVAGSAGFPAPAGPRPTAAAASLVLATVYYRDRPFDQEFVDFFAREVRPELVAAGVTPLACLQTEYAENTFPALPVRTGEHVFIWFGRLAQPADLAEHRDRLAGSAHWRRSVQPALAQRTAGPPQELRLAPTDRSALR